MEYEGYGDTDCIRTTNGQEKNLEELGFEERIKTIQTKTVKICCTYITWP